MVSVGMAWRRSGFMGSIMWCSKGCGGRSGALRRSSAMSRPVSVAAQKKAGLEVHPIWRALGTTIIVSVGCDCVGSWGRT